MNGQVEGFGRKVADRFESGVVDQQRAKQTRLGFYAAWHICFCQVGREVDGVGNEFSHIGKAPVYAAPPVFSMTCVIPRSDIR